MAGGSDGAEVEADAPREIDKIPSETPSEMASQMDLNELLDSGLLTRAEY